MGTVTQYNLANVRDALGGSNPVSMSQYYRGGARVPSSRTVVTRDPTSGEYYNRGSYGAQLASGWTEKRLGSWSNTVQSTNYTIVFSNVTGNISSHTFGGWTYFKGTYRTKYFYNDPYGPSYENFYYGYWREQYSSTSINTGVPSSGQISISQLYGAVNP
jgi:hypothetical protein